MQLGSASMHWSVPEMAWNLRFGGTLRHACTGVAAAHNPEVAGSNPAPLLTEARICGPFVSSSATKAEANLFLQRRFWEYRCARKRCVSATSRRTSTALVMRGALAVAVTANERSGGLRGGGFVDRPAGPTSTCRQPVSGL